MRVLLFFVTRSRTATTPPCTGPPRRRWSVPGMRSTTATCTPRASIRALAPGAHQLPRPGGQPRRGRGLRRPSAGGRGAGALLSGVELRSAGSAQGLFRSRLSAGRQLRSERRRADCAAPAAHPQDRGDRHLRAPAPGRLVHGRPAPPVLHARPAPSDPPRRPRRVSGPLPHECLDRGDARAFSPRSSAPRRGSESRCTRPAVPHRGSAVRRDPRGPGCAMDGVHRPLHRDSCGKHA
jgi:hypothetical protein